MLFLHFGGNRFISASNKDSLGYITLEELNIVIRLVFTELILD